MDLQSTPTLEAGPSSCREIALRRETVGQILERCRGIGPGFDNLRFSLSIMIFVVHVGAIMLGTEAINEDTKRQIAAVASGDPGHGWKDVFFAYWGALRPVRFALSGTFVPMFFALSGFLVTGSAFRLRNLRSFLMFRVIRIVPALSGEVLLSAFILGPLFTIVPLSKYFTDPQFFRYFGNILGFITYELPGLFVNNPLPKTINGNLWTLPGEFYCYFFLALAMVSGVAFDRTRLTGLFIAVTIGLLIASGGFGYAVDEHTQTTRSVEITYYFLMGSVFYHWRDRLPVNLGIGLFVCVVTCVLLNFRQAVFVTPFFLTYLTVILGVTKWPPIPLIKTGDYSYGIYLYGFPMCQAVSAALPNLRGHGILLPALALLLTILFAVCSWHFLERPCLKLKRLFIRA